MVAVSATRQRRQNGAGWGTRFVESMAAGCVAVVAQPFVLQPFEEVLALRQLSLRIDADDVPHLPRLLEEAMVGNSSSGGGAGGAGGGGGGGGRGGGRGSSSGVSGNTPHAAMLRAVQQSRAAFVWAGTHGLAFNVTLLALCHRATELHGALRAQADGASCAHMARRLAQRLPDALLGEEGDGARISPPWYTPSLRAAIAELQAERRAQMQSA